MIPTQNMIDDCDLRYASDIPTIVRLVMDLGKSTDCVDVDVVKTFNVNRQECFEHIISLV